MCMITEELLFYESCSIKRGINAFANTYQSVSDFVARAD